MKWPYQITGLVLLAFAAFVVRESLALEYWTPKGPGPGFFPLWSAILLGFLAVVMSLRAAFGQSEPMAADFFASRSGYLRVAAIILSMSGAILVIDGLGFRLTVFAFLVFLLFALGRQNLVVTFLVSLAGSFGTYYVFVELLDVFLPVGLLGI